LVRILELQGHPFFIGTLYVPQARSKSGDPHPLVTAFVAAAHNHFEIQATGSEK
jgi:CTP synthase (UTP-ammonia lyase)